MTTRNLIMLVCSWLVASSFAAEARAQDAPSVVEDNSQPSAALDTQLSAAVGTQLSAADDTQLTAAVDTPHSAGSEPGSSGARGVYANVSVGGGFGARAIAIPSRRSDRRLSTGLFPALQVGLQGEFALRRVLLGAAATYNTAVGLEAASVAPQLGDSVRGAQLRSNSLTLGLVPGYRFGAPYDSVALRFFVGWAFRSMHTVVDLETPSYSLHGPTLRPELTIPLVRGRIVIRVAPELQVIAGVSRILAQLSNTSLPGVAIGGETSVQVRIIEGLFAALAYRESYALVNTAWDSYVRDSERFVTLQILLRRH